MRDLIPGLLIVAILISLMWAIAWAANNEHKTDLQTLSSITHQLERIADALEKAAR